MRTQDKLQNAPRVYRTFNGEFAQYRKLVFELRKGELQYFIFESDRGSHV
ncbi:MULTISPECIES: hypothetical protein [Leuconostoc]|uniref:UDP-N-acetylmuramate--L-alanine ligase n=2 Tax=Leuconostoc kimchii TaxID=136609 RepID=D5T5K5_LEUKI|nr:MULTISPECIES: hypothetical protein [Leuconostoc]ADG41335.1 UDP-N-acetylmuramate--L-alanine ligase [Leuconostoc kimchii IMSNU 11154]AEJ30685.1 UDP-N-acetylmuramate--L-alanine ligase [Leuconostoc sp. C2]QBR47812.1 UDP-N-acetylmuramate--alanine ligase [Leuconostoc kimchii]